MDNPPASAVSTANSTSADMVYFNGSWRKYHQLTAREQTLFDKHKQVTYILSCVFHLHAYIYIRYVYIALFTAATEKGRFVHLDIR